jgi:hypothetical protein
MEGNKEQGRKGKKRASRETVTDLKRAKEKERCSEVQKRKPLDEEIRGERSTRKKDRGKIDK